MMLELINRRQRQIMLHSLIYEEYDTNLIDDYVWDTWAKELVQLMADNPEIAKQSVYYEDFVDWTGDTATDLNYRKEEIISKAEWFIRRYAMALNKFYHVFGIDTAMLYTDKEKMLDNRIRYWRNKKTEYKNNIKSDTPAEEVQKIKALMTKLEHQVQLAKSELKEELVKNEGVVRTLADDSISERNIVSVFDSSLSRSFGLKEEYVNREVIIIQVYYFEICKSIIKHGFYYKGDKYVFFSSSAGQIRQKKMVCVKESLLKKNWNRLTCGLSVEDINRHGGNNINKYLAYLALCNSATDEWIDLTLTSVLLLMTLKQILNAKWTTFQVRTILLQERRCLLQYLILMVQE